MAATDSSSDRCENMYDPRLKPRVLRALVSDHLPYEEGPVPSRPEMSNVAFTVRTFRLLSESLPGPVDAMLASDWKASVDAWVERVIDLVSCNLPDKNWVGICMLGLTCIECSSSRFLASYPVWLDKLLSHIETKVQKGTTKLHVTKAWECLCSADTSGEPPSDFQSVKLASCNSISDLLTRLGGYANVKKDGTSHAGKVIQPVLKLLNEDTSEAVLDGAIGLFCTLITSFPSPLLRHYANVEAAIVSKILSGRSSIKLLKKYAQCLALLPKSKGDAEHWSLMMQKMLLSLNAYLSNAFQGLEGETQCNENDAIAILAPPEELLVPIGSPTLTEEANSQTTTRSKLFLISTVPALMFCCCTMLTSSYPVQVNIPVRPLLTLIMRVLRVDGSCMQASLALTSVMQQEFISPELPILHGYSLDLLTAIIKGVRSQLLPHVAEIIRILVWYFKRCVLPTLRIKLYSIVRILLTSMGVGVALHVSNEVVSNACIDLDAAGYGYDMELSSLYLKTANETLLLPILRRNEQASRISSLKEHQNGVQPEVHRHCSTFPISLKVAALEALEALLTAGGSLGSQSLRSSADLLLITVAKKACDEERESEEMSHLVQQSEPTSTWADFQLAALHALLASLLSSHHVSPSFLSQGLELFRKGKQKTGTKLADFCAHALLAMEVLMHPRFLPLVNLPTANLSPSHHRISKNLNSGEHETSVPFSTSQGINDPDTDAYLDENWLKSANESQAPWYSPGKDISTQEPSNTYQEHASEQMYQLEKLPENSCLIEQRRTRGAESEGKDGDEIMLELDQFSDIIEIGCVNTPPMGTFLDSEVESRPVFGAGDGTETGEDALATVWASGER